VAFERKDTVQQLIATDYYLIEGYQSVSQKFVPARFEVRWYAWRPANGQLQAVAVDLLIVDKAARPFNVMLPNLLEPTADAETRERGEAIAAEIGTDTFLGQLLPRLQIRPSADSRDLRVQPDGNYVSEDLAPAFSLGLLYRNMAAHNDLNVNVSGYELARMHGLVLLTDPKTNRPLTESRITRLGVYLTPQAPPPPPPQPPATPPFGR
jgi:hypothetical protein